MAVESDPVAGSVPEKFLESCLADLVEALLINFLSNSSFLHVFNSGVVRSEHGIEQALGVIVRLPNRE